MWGASVITATVIIPVWNRWELTEQCLLSLGIDHDELIVIDNGSTDDTTRFRSTIVNDTNLGFAVACNQGARMARSDVLVFLNNDTVCHPGWLEALLKPFDDPFVGITGAHLIYESGATQHAGVTVDFGRLYGYEARNITHDLRVGDYDVTAVTGACLAIRKPLFDLLGGFDEGFINGYEDVDLCLRVGRAGYRIRYASEATVTHLESQTAGRFDHVRHNVDRLRAKWENQ